MAKSISSSDMLDDLFTILSREIRVLKYKSEELELEQEERGNITARDAENLSKDDLAKLAQLSKMLIDHEKEVRERNRNLNPQELTDEELARELAKANELYQGIKDDTVIIKKSKK